MQALSVEGEQVPRQIEQVLTFYQPLLAEKYDSPEKRLSDLEQLQAIAGKFADRTELLADLAIDPPTSDTELPAAAEDRDYLVLSTIHSAKGLEWQAVYLLHACDGMIPPERSVHDEEALEEERRMLYVALTRAADWLYVCYPELHFQPYGRGAGWDRWQNDGLRQLTRFLSGRPQQVFDCQRASTFHLNDSYSSR